MSYASGTSVSIDRSKAEIERLLKRYGCSQFGSGWANEGGRNFAHVTFRHGTTSIMLALPMERADTFLTSPAGHWPSALVAVAAACVLFALAAFIAIGAVKWWREK